MKTLLNKMTQICTVFSILLALSFNANAAPTDHFVTKWQTTTGDTTITIPTTGTGYNYSIDWDGDNSVDETGITGNATHDYGSAGIHTVRITGDFPRIFFDNTGDKDKIISIDQWGTNTWISMRRAFTGASNLVNNALDEPIMATSSSFLQMFLNATSIGTGTGIWDWDTSNVTNMQGMFNNTQFDEDISSWNVENVISFIGMFDNTSLSTANYDALLISWEAQSLSADETFDAGNAQYCSAAAQTARANIVANDGWTINDAGLCNQAPTITTAANLFSPENQSTVVIVSYSDLENDLVTYAKTGGVDMNKFTIDQNTGQLDFITTPDFENPSDSDTDNIYHVEITVTDNATMPASNSQLFNVTVTDEVENQAPVITTPSSISTSENTNIITQITSTDAENNTVTYELTGGVDMDKFTLNFTTGHLDFLAAPDYENPNSNTGTNAYIIEITATDNGIPSPATSTKTFTINVTDLFENQAPTITTDANLFTPENQTFVTTISASDPDSSNLFFLLKSTDDGIRFTLDYNTGQLAFKTPPDFESPTSTTLTNAYVISIRVLDDAIVPAEDEKTITINVTDVNENQAPSILTANEISTPENQLDIITITSSDPEMDNVNYTISGGADSSVFTLNETTDLLSFKIAPDFETPSSNAGSNTYEIEITATDDAITPQFSTKTLNITVTNEIEQNDKFITTWKTDNLSVNSSNSTSITIPIKDNYTYDYHIDWDNDGIFDEFNITGEITHDFGTIGVYTIQIGGDFPNINFDDTGDKQKIIEINQWGTYPWKSFSSSFYGASNLINKAADTPNLSQCISLTQTFSRATSIGNSSDTGNWDWDTSNISQMLFMFNQATSFNKNIGSWQTGNVQFFSSMFSGAISFDQDLSAWDIQSGTIFTDMLKDVTLSTTHYDNLLTSWAAQNIQSGISFNAGNSQYCSQAATDARMSLINNYSWIITDAGQDNNCNPEFIFANSFEQVIIIKTATKKIIYDFSKVKTNKLNTTPKLIIIGTNSKGHQNLYIHIRNDLGQLQIRMSNKTDNTWQIGQWQNVYNQGLTTLEW